MVRASSFAVSIVILENWAQKFYFSTYNIFSSTATEICRDNDIISVRMYMYMY